MYVTALGRRLTAGRCNRNTVFGGDTQGGDNPAVRAILAAHPPARRITPPSKESSVSRVCPSSRQIRGGGSGEAHMSDTMLTNWLSLGGKLPRSPVAAGFRKPRAQAKTEGQAMPTARGRGPGRPHGSFRPQSHARRGADEVRHCPRSSHAVQWARSQALGRREGSSSPKRDFSAARHAMSDLGPARTWCAHGQPSASHHYGAGPLPAVRLPRTPCQLALDRHHTHFSPHLLTTNNDN